MTASLSINLVLCFKGNLFIVAYVCVCTYIYIYVCVCVCVYIYIYIIVRFEHHGLKGHLLWEI